MDFYYDIENKKIFSYSDSNRFSYSSIYQSLKLLRVSSVPNTINSIINDFQTEGFVHTFSVIKDEIGCSGPRKLYKPAEVKIVKQNNYRVNPLSPSGAVVYALETIDGYKGILINRCGIFADKAIDKFIQKTSI